MTTQLQYLMQDSHYQNRLNIGSVYIVRDDCDLNIFLLRVDYLNSTPKIGQGERRTENIGFIQFDSKGAVSKIKLNRTKNGEERDVASFLRANLADHTAAELLRGTGSPPRFDL